jgi:hypothetical protein
VSEAVIQPGTVFFVRSQISGAGARHTAPPPPRSCSTAVACRAAQSDSQQDGEQLQRRALLGGMAALSFLPLVAPAALAGEGAGAGKALPSHPAPSSLATSLTSTLPVHQTCALAWRR